MSEDAPTRSEIDVPDGRDRLGRAHQLRVDISIAITMAPAWLRRALGDKDAARARGARIEFVERIAGAIERRFDLDGVRDGRNVQVAGIILVRQKPGSAKGVLFITIEDETGIANGILWPDRFEAQRRAILSSAMVGLRGRLQREGLVTHVIIDRVFDYTDMLRGIGGMSFPHRPGFGDGATHGGGPDPRDAKWPKPHEGFYPPFDGGSDPEDVIRVRSHDFH